MMLQQNSMPCIILPSAATTREQYSAETLQKYLSLVFGGAAPEVKTDSEPIPAAKILIGGPERNALTAKYMTESEFDAPVPGPEGMMIRSLDENTLLLAGSSKHPTECERGTIYAVYEFLERYLECSFAAYVNPNIPGGNHIPKLEQMDLQSIDYVKAAADSSYRTAIVQYADEQGNPEHGFNIAFLDYLVQNRYNRILTWMGIYDAYKENGILPELERRGFRLTAGHHSALQKFLPPFGNEDFPEHYAETHPEYYRLEEDGKRLVPKGWYGQWIVCRNAVDQMAENIISWIKENPAVDIIALWPQDGSGSQCLCEACRPHSKVKNYTWFLNEVAKKVSSVHPYVKIDMLAYVDLWECPEDISLEPCLMVDEALWHSSGLRHCGAPDGSGIIGTFYEQDLQKWHEKGADVVYYDYYMGVYPARQRWVPMADEIQAVCQHNQKTGVLGTGTQIECFNIWNHALNFYVFARTAYDNSISLEAHLPRFTRLFGKAAPYIAQILRQAEECLDGQVPIKLGGLYIMEHMDKNALYALYDQALAAAETPAHRNNVRMLRMAFRYTELESRESLVKNEEYPYFSLKKYQDPTGELYYMSTHFDSFLHNDPGYGITVPVDCKPSDYQPDAWYQFETEEE